MHKLHSEHSLASTISLNSSSSITNLVSRVHWILSHFDILDTILSHWYLTNHDINNFDRDLIWLQEDLTYILCWLLSRDMYEFNKCGIKESIPIHPSALPTDS